MEAPICYIMGAGEDHGERFSMSAGDLLIAADGGYARLKSAGLQPDLVVGDLDSLLAEPEGAPLLRLPRVKDVTDTWAAVEEGIRRGYHRFALYGCTGGRFDHTLANLQTLAMLAERGLEGTLNEGRQVITAMTGSRRFGPEYHGFLSVFSLTDRCEGVSLKGLKYELEDATLTNRFPLGVSNEFLGKEAEVTVEKGIALLVYTLPKKQ